MKCRNCLSSFENRRSTRNKMISCTAQCLRCFTHIKFEHDIVESCVGLCAGRSESRIVTGGMCGHHPSHCQALSCAASTLSPDPAGTLRTHHYHSSSELSIYLCIEVQTSYLRGFKSKICCYIEYGARIHYKDQDNAADNMWRQEVRSGHQHLESVLSTLRCCAEAVCSEGGVSQPRQDVTQVSWQVICFIPSVFCTSHVIFFIGTKHKA